MAKQLSMFRDERDLKVKYQWSVYAVPKYYDGGHIETVVSAYTEKQARFLFYKNHSDYMIVEAYKV